MDPLITQSEGLTAIDEKYDLNNLEAKYQFYLLELLLFHFVAPLLSFSVFEVGRHSMISRYRAALHVRRVFELKISD